MGVVVAFANQKGGVAKTTTVHALADAFVDRGRTVLMVDLDPQACLTYATGIDVASLDVTVHDVMLGRATAEEALVDTYSATLLPSSIDLAGSEVNLLGKSGREYVLTRALAPVRDDFEVVLVDCGPSLGILTINALTAADHVAVPFQCETLSHRAVDQLLDTVADVRRYTNERIAVLGAIATMWDPRTRLGRSVLAEMTERHDIAVLDPPIPRSVRVAEAPGRGRSILRHAAGSRSAAAYRELATTIEEAL